MNHNNIEKANLVARKLFRKYYGFYPEHFSPIEHRGFPDGIEGHLGALRKTKVFCSSPQCCGNPRKGKMGEERLTIQERKAPTIDEEWY